MDKYRKNKQEKAVSQSHNATSHCQFTYKNINLLSLTVAEKSITKNYSIDCMERKKKNKFTEEQIGQSRFSIPRYNLLLFCTPNLNFLSYTVVEISLTKCREKEKWINIWNNK